MPPNTIYAEYLPNISQISLHVTLSTVINDKTTIKLDTDCRILCLRHHENEVSLLLPCQVAPETLAQVSQLNSMCFSFRLQAAQTGRVRERSPYSAEDEVPWSAERLDANSKAACRFCKATIIAGQIKFWRNLPSDHWIEMMDFWHCHKPNSEIEGSQIDEDASKAYIASDKLTVRSGVGLVNTSCFMVYPGDFPTLQVSQHLSLNHPTLNDRRIPDIHKGQKEGDLYGPRPFYLHGHRYNSPR